MDMVCAAHVSGLHVGYRKPDTVIGYFTYPFLKRF